MGQAANNIVDILDKQEQIEMILQLSTAAVFFFLMDVFGIRLLSLF